MERGRCIWAGRTNGDDARLSGPTRTLEQTAWPRLCLSVYQTFVCLSLHGVPPSAAAKARPVGVMFPLRLLVKSVNCVLSYYKLTLKKEAMKQQMAERRRQYVLSVVQRRLVVCHSSGSVKLNYTSSVVTTGSLLTLYLNQSIVFVNPGPGAHWGVPGGTKRVTYLCMERFRS